jgi:hypothetical protein
MRGTRALWTLYDLCLSHFPSAGTPTQKLHLHGASR